MFAWVPPVGVITPLLPPYPETRGFELKVQREGQARANCSTAPCKRAIIADCPTYSMLSNNGGDSRRPAIATRMAMKNWRGFQSLASATERMTCSICSAVQLKFRSFLQCLAQGRQQLLERTARRLRIPALRDQVVVMRLHLGGKNEVSQPGNIATKRHTVAQQG